MFLIESKAWLVQDNISTNPATRKTISDFQYTYLIINQIHEADFSASWIYKKYVYADPKIQKAWTTYKDGILAIKRVNKYVS